MDPGEDISSSDLALRYHAPSVIVAAWRGASSSFGSPSVRFGRRRGFVEIVLRYLVAVLSAEVDGGGHPPTPAWRELRRRLDTPTVGMWFRAAVELSRTVLGLPAPITSALAEVLCRPDGTGGIGCTPAHAALTQIIDLRNMDAHDDLPSDAEASRLLAESDAPFRAFLIALRPLRRHVIWCATRVHHHVDRTIEVEVVCLRGIDPPAPRRVTLAQGLPEHVPFLVSPRGDVLLLGPLLAFGAFHVKRDPELRLLKHWRKRPLFGDPIDGNPSPPPNGSFPPGEEQWIAEGHAHVLLLGIVPPGPALDLLLDPDRAEPPPIVPGYVLGDRIGHGASGRVYLAHPFPPKPGLPHDVAVKVLDRSLAADATWRDRLKREYEAMRRLQAPGVVKVYDFLEDAPAGPTIVMEYVRGRDLHATVGRVRLDVDTAVTLCEEVLAALGEAHALHIVHRDIKPSNILLDDVTGRARVLDFGIARVEGDRTLTRTSDGLGTVAFAAPEQIEGRAVDGRADLFGVGRLLGYLVSGSTLPVEHAASLPGALQAVYRRATDNEPSERWPDTDTFREALRRARADRWDGAPIGPGQALHLNTRVEKVLERLKPGLWVMRGRDEGSGAVGLIVAERHEAATTALQRALQGLGPAERAALENPRLTPTADGLLWCFLPASDPLGAARMLLGIRPPSPAPSPAAPPRDANANASANKPDVSPFARGAIAFGTIVASASPLGMAATLFGVAARNKVASVTVPPYLEGWSPAEPGWAPKALAARLDDLALVIHAQAHVLGAPLDADDWLVLRQKPLRAASQVLADPVGRWPALLARHLEKTTTRHRALQAVHLLQAWLETGVSEPPGRAQRAEIDAAAGILHALALTASTKVTPEQLAPWVYPTSEGWCARGDMQRFYLPLGRSG